jgi:hypothetical protein
LLQQSSSLLQVVPTVEQTPAELLELPLGLAAELLAMELLAELELVELLVELEAAIELELLEELLELAAAEELLLDDEELLELVAAATH